MIAHNIIATLGKSASLKIQSGDLSEAEELLNKILCLESNNFHALLLLGSILGSMGRPKEAITPLKKAQKINSKDLHVLHNLGKALFDTQAYSDSIAVFKELLSLGGPNSDVFIDIGTAHLRCGKPELAIEYYDEAILHSPLLSAAWNNKSAALLELKNLDSAELINTKALELDDGNADAWLNRGNIFFAKELFDEAIKCFTQSKAIFPGIAKAHIGIANALTKLGKEDLALNQYVQTIEQFPENADAHYNLGTFYDSIKDYENAIKQYEEALRINPLLSIAGWNLSLSSHLSSNLQKGWDFYHHRWELVDYPRKQHQNIPPLRSLAAGTNKSVLVWHEQGLGDSIQFSRFLPLLAKMGYLVTFDCQKPLINLLGCLQNISLTSGLIKPSKFDFQVPLLDLPKLFGINISNIPTPDQYLTADEDRSIYWEKLINGERNQLPNIGIACSGNINHQNDVNRSIPLSVFLPLSTQANLFLLQNHLRASDKPALESMRINHITASIDDFADTAAIVNSMDLIISVDTSIAHLSGALGKITWLLLPFHNDFRWLSNGTTSPWYGKMELFRQKSKGDWSGVIADITSALSKIAPPA